MHIVLGLGTIGEYLRLPKQNPCGDHAANIARSSRSPAIDHCTRARAAIVEQDINDPSSARADYALQQSVIASLSQQALLGGNLQQLFEDATRWARATLGIARCKVMELQPDHESLIGKTGSGWEPGAVPTIVAHAGAHSRAGYA